MRLNSELNNLQRGFISSNKKLIASSLQSLSVSSDELLGNKDKMMGLLPKKMKCRKHKVNIASRSAREIKQGVKRINNAMFLTSVQSPRKREIEAQNAYFDIINACFKCHNLVRDKERNCE